MAECYESGLFDIFLNEDMHVQEPQEPCVFQRLDCTAIFVPTKRQWRMDIELKKSENQNNVNVMTCLHFFTDIPIYRMIVLIGH